MKLILLLILLGGTVAILGNTIGRAIGRRRLSIFNLRPRHTAAAITVLSGILIVVMTLAVILVVSQDARTALFGLDKLKTELAAKQTELLGIDQQLLKAQQSIKKLNTSRAELKQEVERSRIGDLLFRVDEVLLTSVIVAGADEAKITQGLKQILTAADLYIRTFGDTAEKQLIYVSPAAFKRTVDRLKNETGDFIVSVAAEQNTIFGETVHVRLELDRNRLIYPAGQEIASAFIPTSDSQPAIEQAIKNLLLKTNQTARRAGVVPNPDGTMGSLPYATILETAKLIKSTHRSVTVKTLAQSNIYSTGPLALEIKIFYQ